MSPSPAWAPRTNSTNSSTSCTVDSWNTSESLCRPRVWKPAVRDCKRDLPRALAAVDAAKGPTISPDAVAQLWTGGRSWSVRQARGPNDAAGGAVERRGQDHPLEVPIGLVAQLAEHVSAVCSVESRDVVGHRIWSQSRLIVLAGDPSRQTVSDSTGRAAAGSDWTAGIAPLCTERAVEITRFGGPEVLDVVDVPEPEPGNGQKLNGVSTAGINVADTHHRVAADSPDDLRRRVSAPGSRGGVRHDEGDPRAAASSMQPHRGPSVQRRASPWFRATGPTLSTRR